MFFLPHSIGQSKQSRLLHSFLYCDSFLGRKPIADVISVDDETDGSRETDTGMFSPLRGDEELQRLR